MAQSVASIDESIRKAANQQTQSLLEAAWAIRDAAEQRRKRIRQAFELLAQKLCAQSLDQKHIDLAEIGDQALFDFIVADAKNRLDEGVWYKRQYDEKVDVIGAATQDLQSQLTTAQKEITELQARLAQTKQKLADADIANRGYATDVTTLQASVKLLERTAAERTVKAAPGGPQTGASLAADGTLSSGEAASIPPDWLERWMQSTTYMGDAAFLKMVGSSYECRRQALIDLFAQQERGREKGGSDGKIPDRLMGSGLLMSTTTRGLRGNQPYLLSLSPKGKEAYRLIFDENPLAVYEHYIGRHKSVEQVYLMLEASDALMAAGFTVDRLPPSKTLPGNKHFAPDLRACRGAEELFIEIETETYKNDEQREAKWRTIAAGTTGHIYVITQTAHLVSPIRSEIQNKRYGFPVAIGVASLGDIQAAVRQGQPLWRDMRSTN